MVQLQLNVNYLVLSLFLLGFISRSTETETCSRDDTISCSSTNSGYQRPLMDEINLLAPTSSQRLQEFINVYRHISTFDIKWETNLLSIPEASYEQIQEIIRTKSGYPKVQGALQLMEMGDGPFLKIVMEDNQTDKFAHVILAYKRTKKGVRRLSMCEFQQVSSRSVGGFLGTLVVSTLIGYVNPSLGIMAFIAKVSIDYGVSKQDVSVIVALKLLVDAGFLRLDEATMRFELANENFISLNSNYSCDVFTLNNSIVNIFLKTIQETRLIAVIYPPLDIKNNFCSNFEPMERSGSAIGDLNGDGILDIVDITTFITKLKTHDLHSFIAHSVLTRFSLDTNKIEKQLVAIYQKDIFNKTIDQNLLNLLKEKTSFPTKSIYDKDLHIISKQTWNGYLGRLADSHYYRNI